MSPLPSSLPKPLIFLVVIGYYFSSYTYASALAQPEDEGLYKTASVPDISVYAVGDPLPMKLTIDVGIIEDDAWKATYFRQPDLDMARREPDAVGVAVYIIP